MRTRFRLLLIATLLPSTPACRRPVAESDPAARVGAMGKDQAGVYVGERVRIASSVLGEERELLVQLPGSYHTTQERYPVLYLLDGENDFLHTAGIVDYLGGIDRTPELILVGVVNTHRSRDLTPPSDNAEETAFWDEVGGAERFRAFLRDEAIPFVDRTYRTQPYRILRGQSFGGLFAIHDAMSPAPVFDAVLASSPGVGWNHGELLDEAPAYFATRPDRAIYIASAGRDFPGNLKAVREYARLADAAGLDPERWRHEHFPTESHYSLHHLSTYRGLEFLYASWPVPPDVAGSADYDAYERHFAALSQRFGYPIPIPMRSIVRVGNQLLREQRFDDGIAVFERALESRAELPEAHWRVGEAYRLAGRLEEALPHFERALSLASAKDLPDLADYREALERTEGELKAKEPRDDG